MYSISRVGNGKQRESYRHEYHMYADLFTSIYQSVPCSIVIDPLCDSNGDAKTFNG